MTKTRQPIEPISQSGVRSSSRRDVPAVLARYFGLTHGVVRPRLALLLAGIVLCGAWPAAEPAAAAVPQTLNYQGKLADPVGNPLSGVYSFRFKLYSESTGGTLLFTESLLGAAAVSVVNGIYTVQIGTSTAGGIPISVFDGDAVFLEVDVSPGATLAAAETLLPRKPILGSPYAIHAFAAERLGIGANVSSHTAAGDLHVKRAFTSSTGTFLGQDAAGYSLSLSSGINLAAGTVNAGELRLASALAAQHGGTGLSAAGSSGNLLLSDGAGWSSRSMTGDATITFAGALTLAAGAVDTAKLADDAVTGPKVADRSLPLGKLNQSGCTTGQVAKWNGTAWACGTATGAGVEEDPKIGANTLSLVPRWDGASLVAGTIFDDTSNIGVGTTAPAAKLDVEGGAQFGSGASKSTFTAAGALRLATALEAGYGGTGLSAAGASGNLLLSNGAAWTSAGLSGDATVMGGGVLTLSAAAVDTAKIKSDSIDSTKILTGAVQTDKLGTDAITSAAILNRSVTDTKL